MVLRSASVAIAAQIVRAGHSTPLPVIYPHDDRRAGPSRTDKPGSLRPGNSS